MKKNYKIIRGFRLLPSGFRLPASVFCLLLFCFLPFSLFAQLNWTGTQTLTNGQTVSQNINLTGNVTINVASGSATISGVISSSSNYTVTKTGSGELYFTGNNTYTGNTTISAGDLYIGNNTTAGAVAGNISVASSAYLNFGRSNNYTYSGVISGAGSVWQSSSGKVILTGANTYTGTTVVNGGTMQVGNGTSTTATINTTSGVTISYGAILRFEPGAAYTFSKVISGDGGKVECAGSLSNPLYLTANNTYTGTTTIGARELYVGGNSAAMGVEGGSCGAT
jgi:fibronectin-binding autotransporter adhesin